MPTPNPSQQVPAPPADAGPDDSDFDPNLHMDPRDIPAPPVRPDRTQLQPDAAARRKFPLHLVHAARRYGFQDSEIDAYSPEELSEELHRIRLDEMRREQDQYRGGRAEPRREPEPPPEPDDLARLGVTPEAFPELQPVFKFFKDKIDAQDRENRQLREHIQQRDVSSNAEKLDNAFALLPASYRKRWGNKAGSEVQPGSPEARVMLAVIAAAGLDLNRPLPAAAIVSQRVAEAAEMVFGAESSAPERPDDTGRPADPYQAMQLAAPRQGNGQLRRQPADDRRGPHPDDEDAELERESAERRRAQESWLNGNTIAPTQRRAPPRPKTEEEAKRRAAEELAAAMQQRRAGRGATYRDAEEDTLLGDS